MNSNRIARIVVSLSLDRNFDYRIPEKLIPKIRIGSMVKVPFGKGYQTGYVIAFPKKAAVADLKEVQEIIGDREILPSKLIQLADWISDYYCCTKEQAIKAIIPAVIRTGSVKKKVQKTLHLTPDLEIASTLENLEKKAPKQAEVVKALVKGTSYPLGLLKKMTKTSSQGIRALVQKGIIQIEESTEDRNPFSEYEILPTSPLKLNADQQQALDKIHHSFDKPQRDVILLFGLTGSGKTEVYLQGISESIKRGLEAIVLVPEIALTPQTVERFRGRFGDQVSILHSHLSDGERFDEWTKINEGRVKIAIGARSALFAPFRSLGLIIIDEEHESTYKQDTIPRYQARDIAVVRGKIENATVVLGSATPSFESFHNTGIGKYVLSRLSHRIDEQPLPKMEIVDLGVEATDTGQTQILSRRLVQVAQETLDAGEQIILFLNRRGYATQLQCLKCGFVASCDDCSLNYTYHRTKSHLICHTCGAVKNAPNKCPECNDSGIRFGGLGTQRVETVIKKVFPYARTFRMDSDTMTKKDAYRKALTSFRAGDIDILIGTQMIAKGLHFPNVTLVGIIFADQGLNLPDFRAGEKTFQLLVQVAGRSGRGDVPGRVIVQTYTPYNQVLLSAVKHDFEEFYQCEIKNRKTLKFPPIQHLLMIIFRGEDDNEVREIGNQFYEFMYPQLNENAKLTPCIPCPVSKKRKQYYYQILMNTPKIVTVSRTIKTLLAKFKRPKRVSIQVDVDPYSL